MKTITANKKTNIKYITKLILGLLIIALLFYYFGFEESLRTLSRLNPAYLAMAFLIHFTSWIWRSYRLKAMFSDQNITSITKYQIIKINFAGYALNILLPFKLGEISRMYLFHKETKIPVKASITSVIYTRIFDMVTLSIFGIISLLFILNDNPVQNQLNYFIIFISIISLIILATSTTIQKKLVLLLRQNKPKLAEIIESFKMSRKCRITCLIYSSLIWFVDGISIYLILKGLNQDVSLSIAFLGLVVANIIKSFPTTPGGIGLFESSMAFLFISLGINQNTSIVAATLDHFIKTVPVLILGIYSLSSYKYDISTVRKWPNLFKNTMQTIITKKQQEPKKDNSGKRQT